jgi:translation initiation factor 1 (eIF-1/SUI1)
VSTVPSAGAKGGGGKKPNNGANPFASSDLMALRGTLPSKPELASDTSGGGGGNDMVRMSEADVLACFSKKNEGGSMKSKRSKLSHPGDGGKAKKPGSIGSGIGSSRGVDPGLQKVTVGVTRSGTKGKTVTVIDGLDVGSSDGAKELIKQFKKILGSGGGLAENGSMSFQGDNAALLVDMLKAMGYKSARQTGGLGAKK